MKPDTEIRLQKKFAEIKTQFAEIVAEGILHANIIGCTVIICHKYYSIEIIKITASESAAYTGMLVLDGITVADMYFGCDLSKHLRCDSSVCRVRRRSFVYVLLVLHLYLVSCWSITENHYTSISLL